jgi:predicted O-methyltransferase YrrM
MNLLKSFRRMFRTQDEQSKPKDLTLEYLQRNVRHFMPSYILSLDDELFPANQRLVDLSLKAARSALEINLSEISQKFPFDVVGRYINVWPGEHYRLLAAIVKELKPQLVIEIGTATGASSLVMKKYLPLNGKIITYDIIPWNVYPDSGLSQQDFGEQLEQRVMDITFQDNAESQYNVLQRADLIFVDGAKDGVSENAFIKLFDRISFENNPIVFFDDIKFEIMIKIWRDIKHPKLDITSFGHWSGTGLVDWNNL